MSHVPSCPDASDLVSLHDSPKKKQRKRKIDQDPQSELPPQHITTKKTKNCGENEKLTEQMVEKLYSTMKRKNWSLSDIMVEFPIGKLISDVHLFGVLFRPIDHDKLREIAMKLKNAQEKYDLFNGTNWGVFIREDSPATSRINESHYSSFDGFYGMTEMLLFEGNHRALILLDEANNDIFNKVSRMIVKLRVRVVPNEIYELIRGHGQELSSSNIAFLQEPKSVPDSLAPYFNEAHSVEEQMLHHSLFGGADEYNLISGIVRKVASESGQILSDLSRDEIDAFCVALARVKIIGLSARPIARLAACPPEMDDRILKLLRADVSLNTSSKPWFHLISICKYNINQAIKLVDDGLLSGWTNDKWSQMLSTVYNEEKLKFTLINVPPEVLLKREADRKRQRDYRMKRKERKASQKIDGNEICASELPHADEDMCAAGVKQYVESDGKYCHETASKRRSISTSTLSTFSDDRDEINREETVNEDTLVYDETDFDRFVDSVLWDIDDPDRSAAVLRQVSGKVVRLLECDLKLIVNVRGRRDILRTLLENVSGYVVDISSRNGLKMFNLIESMVHPAPTFLGLLRGKMRVAGSCTDKTFMNDSDSDDDSRSNNDNEAEKYDSYLIANAPFVRFLG